jgi:hypothetical protein
MFPNGQIAAPAAVPAAAPAPAPAAPAYVAPDGVSEGLPQGTPHPGDMTFPAPTPAPAPADPAQVAPTPADPSAQALNAPAPEAAALTSSARAMAAAMGFEAANRFADDRSFMEAVLAQAQGAAQAQQQLTAMQNYQAALAQAQALAAQQKAAQNAPAPAAKLNALWNPPEFNPSWDSLVKTGADGVPTLVPGAPAEILPKYLAYQQYRKQFADKFLSNPEETLLPLINSAAIEQAREVVRKEWEARQQESYIQGFVQENEANRLVPGGGPTPPSAITSRAKRSTSCATASSRRCSSRGRPDHHELVRRRHELEGPLPRAPMTGYADTDT